MKRVKDGIKIIKGKVTMNSYQQHENKIQLFDGKFTTGYRVTMFKIFPKSPQNVEEVQAILTTEKLSGTPTSFDLSSNTDVAYAFWNVPDQTKYGPFELVIRDNMVVQDLWISNYSTGDEEWLNYYIELEKYEFSAWDGASTLVRNQSQAGPQ